MLHDGRLDVKVIRCVLGDAVTELDVAMVGNVMEGTMPGHGRGDERCIGGVRSIGEGDRGC